MREAMTTNVRKRLSTFDKEGSGNKTKGRPLICDRVTGFDADLEFVLRFSASSRPTLLAKNLAIPCRTATSRLPSIRTAFTVIVRASPVWSRVASAASCIPVFSYKSKPT
jgi:hypothetical protein